MYSLCLSLTILSQFASKQHCMQNLSIQPILLPYLTCERQSEVRLQNWIHPDLPAPRQYISLNTMLCYILPHRIQPHLQKYNTQTKLKHNFPYCITLSFIKKYDYHPSDISTHNHQMQHVTIKTSKKTIIDVIEHLTTLFTNTYRCHT